MITRQEGSTTLPPSVVVSALGIAILFACIFACFGTDVLMAFVDVEREPEIGVQVSMGAAGLFALACLGTVINCSRLKRNMEPLAIYIPKKYDPLLAAGAAILVGLLIGWAVWK